MPDRSQAPSPGSSFSFGSPVKSIAIRVATSAEAGAIAALVNRAYRGEEGLKGWTTEAAVIRGQRVDPDGVLQLMRPPRSLFLLAYSQREPARLLGSANVARHDSGDGYFGMLAVEPDAQAGGVGGALIGAAEAWARQAHGAPGMRLTVITIRPELIAYYERRGYAATGEREPYPYGQPRFGEPLVPGLELATYRKPF
jgi:GNAT superfamily N-acetyltransferase